MNNLTSRALELQRLAHELIYLGVDGEPIYSDTFCRLNKDVLLQCDSLFLLRGSTSDEEANLCLALLLAIMPRFMTTVIRSVISSLCLIVLLRCSNSFPPPC